MAQVGKEVRFQTWTWVGVLVVLGIALGCSEGIGLLYEPIIFAGHLLATEGQWGA
jgi:hypothetical protein